MSTVRTVNKACTVNPLKLSQPVGGALAFMGLDNAMPLLHGSQGCTAFGMVLFVRHFRETVPLQTTAMSEVATVMGGLENIGKAILSIYQRAKPSVIGICSTGVTETKGDDVDGYLKTFMAAHPELGDLVVVYVSTPDFKDAFQDGWAKTVAQIVGTLPDPQAPKVPGAINFLVGSHMTVADVEELRDISEAFGLKPTILPDLSGSMDGHVPENFSPTTLGGTTVPEIRAMGGAEFTIAVGEQMRPAAEALMARTGQSYMLFDRLTGIEANDQLLECLSQISGRPVPLKYRRQRSQLMDAMLDSHFFYGGKRFAIGAEPDLLWSLATLFAEMGAEIAAAVTTTQSPMLERLPCAEVLIGDLEDLEDRAKDCDILITTSHGRQAAERLHIPFVRMGLPIFDRLGATHRLSIGYRGTRDLLFEIGNVLMANEHENHPESWPLPAENHAARPTLALS
ncbi:nitrogenase iron-molybdenum cofactor biosynthesis protein NifN [Halothiobacillus diazotrophicus]|uniref:Nitrogenase iron-molybdenum cofactor biosynthesis protein NifN n=1 Tax=Halothiobacillus diazotrophicus TaxID=1860122 RepID=A0A191ZEE8_9GAMM|nr:nitrogenase iron-molybdenum cofactor biosynthesis protein NifN [Halothiobacillus diazotrophicus]ANJ66242.1 nitrogenase iron-molybdenum cofactor biosynthesis protein NifN [Halothiobacillus diazotrophicus]